VVCGVGPAQAASIAAHAIKRIVKRCIAITTC
jgi:hypothetical protein